MDAPLLIQTSRLRLPLTSYTGLSLNGSPIDRGYKTLGRATRFLGFVLQLGYSFSCKSVISCNKLSLSLEHKIYSNFAPAPLALATNNFTPLQRIPRYNTVSLSKCGPQLRISVGLRSCSPTGYAQFGVEVSTLITLSLLK